MNSIVALVAAVVVIAIIAVLILSRKKSSDSSAGTPQQDEIKGDQPIMYALTTCQHCKNTRKFLDANNVDYIVIYLDEYAGSQRSNLMEKVRTYNPRGTFPTILVPGGKVIVGFRKQLMQEALIHDPGTAA